MSCFGCRPHMPGSITGTAVIFYLAGRQDRQYHYVSPFIQCPLNIIYNALP